MKASTAFALSLTLVLVASVVPGTSGYKNRLHSFESPFFAGGRSAIPNWTVGEGVLVTDDYIRLTPATKSRQGLIINDRPLRASSWSAAIEFRTHGGGRRQGADGFAFWVTRAKPTNGPIFGAAAKWRGLGILFDSFDNNGDGKHPSITGVWNDGADFEAAYANDFVDNTLGTCTFDYRNSKEPVIATVSYVNRRVTVSLRSGAKEELCFDVGITVPAGYFLSFSASTGAVTDNHDLHGLIMETGLSVARDEATRQKALPAAKGSAVGTPKIEGAVGENVEDDDEDAPPHDHGAEAGGDADLTPDEKDRLAQEQMNRGQRLVDQGHADSHDKAKEEAKPPQPKQQQQQQQQQGGHSHGHNHEHSANKAFAHHQPYQAEAKRPETDAKSNWLEALAAKAAAKKEQQARREAEGFVVPGFEDDLDADDHEHDENNDCIDPAEVPLEGRVERAAIGDPELDDNAGPKDYAKEHELRRLRIAVGRIEDELREMDKYLTSKIALNTDVNSVLNRIGNLDKSVHQAAHQIAEIYGEIQTVRKDVNAKIDHFMKPQGGKGGKDRRDTAGGVDNADIRALRQQIEGLRSELKNSGGGGGGWALWGWVILCQAIFGGGFIAWWKSRNAFKKII